MRLQVTVRFQVKSAIQRMKRNLTDVWRLNVCLPDYTSFEIWQELDPVVEFEDKPDYKGYVPLIEKIQ